LSTGSDILGNLRIDFEHAVHLIAAERLPPPLAPAFRRSGLRAKRTEREAPAIAGPLRNSVTKRVGRPGTSFHDRRPRRKTGSSSVAGSGCPPSYNRCLG
jgi:hypothetical protein